MRRSKSNEALWQYSRSEALALRKEAPFFNIRVWSDCLSISAVLEVKSRGKRLDCNPTLCPLLP